MIGCEQVDRWLDQDGPESDAAACRAHAASCARCTAALAAALEIETLLAADFAPAPATLTPQVMARVTVARRAEWQVAPPAFEWWVRAAAQPSVVLAFAIAALLIWRGNLLLALTGQGTVWLGGQLAGAARAVPAAFDPATRAALWFTLLIGAPWASWLLFRWSESYARPHGAPRRAGAGGRARVS